MRPAKTVALELKEDQGKAGTTSMWFVGIRLLHGTWRGDDMGGLGSDDSSMTRGAC